MMPGCSVTLRISRMIDGFRRVARLACWNGMRRSPAESVGQAAGRRSAGIFLPMNTVATTASEKATLAASRRSPSTGTANSSERNGCRSCTWLTRTAPPRASPRYQAKKPSHIENSVTYAKPAQAAPEAGCAGQASAVSGTVSGRLPTSTQQITCSAPMRADMAQREREEERKADHSAGRGHRERRQLGTLRAASARDGEVQRAQHAREGGAAGGDEQRRKLRVGRRADGQARHRQGHREDD